MGGAAFLAELKAMGDMGQEERGGSTRSKGTTPTR